MTPAVGFFGCRVARIASLRATGWTDEGRYLVDLVSRHTDLLAAFIRRPEQGVVYDLRFTASLAGDPTEDVPIQAVLLGRVPADRISERPVLVKSLLNLLHATFPELDLEELNPEEVDRAREPFPIRHVIGIRRRCLLAQLDTVAFGAIEARNRTVGFATPSEGAETRTPAPSPPLFHVCSFSPRLRPHDSVLNVLGGEATPISVSVRLAATQLLPRELMLLERQIGHCERYAQVSLGQTSQAMESLMPTLREQARQHQEHQARMLYGLRPGAAEMTIEVASKSPLSSLTVEAIGSLFSAPAGGPEPFAFNPSMNYLAGGFDTCELPPGAAERFSRLEILLPTVPGTPEGGERLPFLFDPREGAAAFRFPAASDSLPAGIEVRGWRLQAAPANLPRQGVVLGRSLGHGLPGHIVHLSADDRLRHVYSVGQTGTGKTSLLRSMVLSDIEAGEGVCLIDPHGDLYKEILENIPPKRWNDVVALDPTDTDWPVGLNLLEYSSEDQRHFLVQELLGIMTRLLHDEYGSQATGQFAGPMFYQNVRMNLLLAMSRPDDPGTLLEFHAIFQSPDYWKRWLPLALEDAQLRFWVDNVLTRTDYLKPGSDGPSLGSYVSSKFDSFVFDPMLRLLFAQKRSTIHFDEIMDGGKILLVNLAKGLLTETNSRFLGMVLLAKLQAAVMARARKRRDERRPFYLYVDEFQSLATSSFVGLLSEARKFGVGMVLANQFLTQVEDQRIVDSILGNAGTLICFRLGQPDAKAMEARLSPTFLASDLQNLPNFHACVATLARGDTLRPFSMRTLYRGVDNPEAERVRREVVGRSRARNARPRIEVEAEIAKSLGTQEQAEVKS
ncbi:MAG: type IV secretion system DNA-binding domain-containing protein [Thermoanaerobaculia bacterium]|nr:type IV secretion system DNA-binding domain-containing protein [Thermoanaerobaculia bacterium]